MSKRLLRLEDTGGYGGAVQGEGVPPARGRVAGVSSRPCRSDGRRRCPRSRGRRTPSPRRCRAPCRRSGPLHGSEWTSMVPVRGSAIARTFAWSMPMAPGQRPSAPVTPPPPPRNAPRAIRCSRDAVVPRPGEGAGAAEVGGGVEQAEDGVDGRAGGRLGQARVDLADHLHPQLDVLPLELPHQLAVAVAQAVQLAVVQGDQRAVVQREVDVALDQGVEDAGRGHPVGLRQPPPGPGQQLAADADQQLGEHRVLAREVPVETGPADADGGAYLVDPDAVETALGEEPGGLLQDLLAAGGGVGSAGHADNSRQRG